MDEREEFIAKLYPAAIKVSEETGMSWELILAQAAQETGWGRKVLPGTNNIFNIKATKDWQGDSKTFNVWEDVGGNKVWMDQSFRVYESIEDALSDRVRFLRENPRYRRAGLFDEGTRGDLVKEAEALQSAGYATHDVYAKKLVEVFHGRTMRRAIALAVGESVGQEPRKDLAKEVLRPGHRGLDVGTLQASLIALGYTGSSGAPLAKDSHFGEQTRQALESFQRDHDLKIDGIAGPATMDALRRVAESTRQSIGVPNADYLHGRQANDAMSPYRGLISFGSMSLLQSATQEERVGEISSPKSPDVSTHRLDHALHPDNELFISTKKLVYDLDREHNRDPDHRSDQLAASLVVAARSAGMERIDYVRLSDDRSTLSAVDVSSKGAGVEATIPVVASMDTPLETSSRRWVEAVAVGTDPERRQEPAINELPRPAQPGSRSAGGAVDARDPRFEGDANHELFRELQRQVPQASDDRLLQFTAACHSNRITADNLTSVRLDEERMTLEFQGAGILSTPARVDLSKPPATPEESLGQIQQFDRQESQIMERLQEQQAQMSMGHSR